MKVSLMLIVIVLLLWPCYSAPVLSRALHKKGVSMWQYKTASGSDRPVSAEYEVKPVATAHRSVPIAAAHGSFGAEHVSSFGQKRSAVVRYACPMHPEVTGRRGGRCRKCGMALRPVKTQTPPSAASDSAQPETGPDQTDAATTVVKDIPDVMVTDQNGQRLHFHRDLIARKVVAINFIFTTCTTICPPLTATFRRVQQELGPSDDVQLISISVDPTTDTPERLRDFAAKFKAGPGWTFVTGDKNEIDSLLKAFGVAVADKNDHTPMILIGNEAVGYWTRTYGLASPLTIAKLISDAKKPR